MPHEAAAIAAASAWLNDQPLAGRPYEMGGDNSGYSIGGLTGAGAFVRRAQRRRRR
jgi:hypothetical protein